MDYKRARINYPNWKNNKSSIKFSPCVRNCCLDDDDICIGCSRSIDEIMQWSQASEQRKKEIMRNVEVRKKAHRKKY